MPRRQQDIALCLAPGRLGTSLPPTHRSFASCKSASIYMMAGSDNLGLEPLFDGGVQCAKLDGAVLLVSDSGAPLDRELRQRSVESLAHETTAGPAGRAAASAACAQFHPRASNRNAWGFLADRITSARSIRCSQPPRQLGDALAFRWGHEHCSKLQAARMLTCSACMATRQLAGTRWRTPTCGGRNLHGEEVSLLCPPHSPEIHKWKKSQHEGDSSQIWVWPVVC